MHGTKHTFTPGDEKGFSLVELLVAMVVTLIVTGAMYGLIASGQTAFRREPEVADRQQNIRIAMDLISRDVANAGGGMPPVSQAFTQSDNAGGAPPLLNGAGPQGVLGAAGVAQRVDVNDNSDILEIVGAEESCPHFTTCAGTLDGTANTLSVQQWIPNPGCLLPGIPRSGFVLLTDNARFAIQPATPGAGVCFGGGANRGVTVGAALPNFGLGGGGPLASAFVHAARVTRYMIGINPDANDPTPALWRSSTGRFNAAGPPAQVTPALVPPGVVPGTNWQLVARGIEDLQVEYMNGGGAWANSPGVIPSCGTATCTPADWPNVIRQVRVTLSARALAPLLAGATIPAGGPAPPAIRGQLVTIITPRPALIGLQSGGQLP